MTNTFMATIGHKTGRGGWFIQEQMIIDASSYDIAWSIAEAKRKRGEQILDVSIIDKRRELAFWGV